MSRTAPLARSAFRSRLLALAVISASSLMFILDGSIVTVAMPAIQRDLDFTPGGLTWVINGYLLVFGGLLLLAGRLGDLLGRKRMFLAGIGVFTLASLVAGLATSPATLIAARVLQGAGSALAAAVGLGILVTMFTEPRDRARAIGVFAFTGAAGASLGQVLGGLLTDLLSWHWIFLINLPIGIAAALLAVPALPADRGLGLAAGSDVPGALLVTTGLMTGIYTLVKVEEYGWTSAHTLGLGAVAAVLLAGFFVRQATARTPLMPLRILRSRNVAGGNLVQILTLAGMFAFQILVALYMQQVLGYSALETGLAMLPAAVGIGGVSLGVSARLIGRFGERAVLLAGLALLTAALLLLTRLPADAAYVPHLLPTMVLITGGGLVLPALSAIGMSGARPDDAGLVSGLLNTTQQIGPAIGVAALSTLAGSRTATELATGASRPEALTAGYTLAFGLGAALLATAFVATLLILRPTNNLGEGFCGETRRSILQNPSPKMWVRRSG